MYFLRKIFEESDTAIYGSNSAFDEFEHILRTNNDVTAVTLSLCLGRFRSIFLLYFSQELSNIPTEI